MPTAIGSYVTTTILKTRAGISDVTDDALLGVICDQVNMFVERTTGRVMAPIASATYLYDGNNSTRLYLPRTADGAYIGGLRAISLLEMRQYTGGQFQTIGSDQYFLREASTPGGPFDCLWFTDYPTGAFTGFPPGYNTVRITGTAGWQAIPDDIAEVAVTIATRAWHARQSGQQDIVGSDEMGRPLVSRFISGRDRDTLREYTLVSKLA